MGKIILVSPPIRVNVPVDQFNQPYSGTSKTHPVLLNGGPNNTLTASVNIQDPTTFHYINDPIMALNSYYTMSGSSGGAFASNRKSHGSYMIHSVEARNIPKAFWSHKELEELVEPFYGDVLLQIDPASADHVVYNQMSKWVFSATDSRDGSELISMVNRRKKHEFRVHKGLRAEIVAWLREHATEYDVFDNDSWANEDTVFVRDDTEAVHFKMKWFGAAPEEENA